MANSNQVMTITVDFLNQEEFLDVIQRAIDLCAVAERTVAAMRAGTPIDPEPLEYSARHFREFFEGDGEEEE